MIVVTTEHSVFHLRRQVGSMAWELRRTARAEPQDVASAPLVYGSWGPLAKWHLHWRCYQASWMHLHYWGPDAILGVVTSPVENIDVVPDEAGITIVVEDEAGEVGEGTGGTALRGVT